MTATTIKKARESVSNLVSSPSFVKSAIKDFNPLASDELLEELSVIDLNDINIKTNKSPGIEARAELYRTYRGSKYATVNKITPETLVVEKLGKILKRAAGSNPYFDVNRTSNGWSIQVENLPVKPVSGEVIEAVRAAHKGSAKNVPNLYDDAIDQFVLDALDSYLEHN